VAVNGSHSADVNGVVLSPLSLRAFGYGREKCWIIGLKTLY